MRKQKLVLSPEPEYPATARVARQQGVVMLAVLINKDGHVQDVAVMSGRLRCWRKPLPTRYASGHTRLLC